MPNFETVLAVIMIIYVFVMFGISVIAQRQVKDTEDFLVAGRRLPLSLAWATLLATWFGAATVLTQSDEVRSHGLQKAALDPLGAGCCLILAGLFFAAPLWKMGLLTIADFFRERYGPIAEFLSACIMVPSYFGWIATQFVALAQMLNALYGLDQNVGILLVAAIGMGYTLMGGMWSVTLTDAIQIALVLLGLVLLGIVALAELGGGNWFLGLQTVFTETDAVLLQPIPIQTFSAFSVWLGVFCIGMLGNIPGQDLMQRLFAAKSANVARLACLLAGAMYLLFGMIPVLLALSSVHLMPNVNEDVIMQLARTFLHPVPLTIFILALLSAILSTIDSAILSPASVLSQNVFSHILGKRISSLLLNRISVLLVTICSVITAYLGDSAYELLEGAYELTLVGMFVPLTLGIYLKPRGQAPAVFSMLISTGLWTHHYFYDWELVFNGRILVHRAIAATLLGLVVYLAVYLMRKDRQSLATH